MAKFIKGDVVRLKSGSPNMTVSRYVEPIDVLAIVSRSPARDMGEPVMVVCIWFDAAKSISREFHEDLLEHVS